MKYRKKPVIVEAWQHFSDAGTHTNAIPMWVIEACTSGKMFARGKDTFLKNHEGEVKLHEGDFIIKGAHGELYHCAAEVFAVAYEPV